MAALTRAAILDADDLPRELVSVPEWGGEVYIRTITGAERDAWEQTLVSRSGKPDIVNIRARLVVACACDDAGAALFTPADAEALGRKSGAALQRLSAVAQRVNKLTDAELEDAAGN